MQIITNSQKETEKIAKNYAKSLKSGDILALQGDLGSGKTVFTKGLAKGLGVKEVITSPTFVVAKQYQIEKPKNRNPKTEKIDNKLIHIDCYRITEDDAETVGLSEYLVSQHNITIIEWPENIKSVLPKQTKFIRFENLGGDIRKIMIGN